MIYLPNLGYCDEIGCQAPMNETLDCYITSWVASQPDQHYRYCGDHAADEGFCYLCGWFALGSSERFEFGPYKGLCDNCKDEVEAEEDDYDNSDEGMYDPYYPDDDYADDWSDWEHDEVQ